MRTTLKNIVDETGIKLKQTEKGGDVAKLTEYMNKINTILASANKDDIKNKVNMDSLKGSLQKVQNIIANEAEPKKGNTLLLR